LSVPPRSPPPYAQQPPPQYGPPVSAPPKKRSPAVAIVAAIVIVIVVILAILFFTTLSSHATLKVRILSAHLFNDVNYELFIDGDLEKTGTLTPLQTVEHNIDLYPGSQCRDYSIYASSTGGELGPMSDTETVNVCAGETKDITLTV